jgi:hypothetical protein
MPTHDARLLQRLLDAIEAENAKFKSIRFAAPPGELFPFTADPPFLYGGSREQRLEALEAWHIEWSARPEAERQSLPPATIARAAEAIGELVRLRQQPTEEEKQ